MSAWTVEPDERACAGCGEPFLGRGRAKWCSERCRKRTCYGGVCVDCGAPTHGSNGDGPNAPVRCHACDMRWNPKRLAARVEYRTAIEAMWADGLTSREIGRLMGWTPGSAKVRIGQLRARGYDLPYRRSPEAVAKFKVCGPANMAKARAARGKAPTR